MYEAKSLSPQKVREELLASGKQKRLECQLKIREAEAFLQGYEACLEQMMGMLTCSNYELDNYNPNAFREGADAMLYELAKELDVSAQEIREMDTGIDEKASLFADEVKRLYNGCASGD